MKILYISDQFLPATSADTEQYVNMVSAMSSQANIELLTASYRYQSPPKLKEIQDYYLVDGHFDMDFIRHWFPNIRGAEKMNFAISAALRVRNDVNTDVVYTRNIPVLIAVLSLTDKPVLFETFRPWPERNLQSRQFFKKMAEHPRFLGIVLHSEFAKQAYLNIGFKEKKLLVAHNAFRSDFFDQISSNRKALRDELALPSDSMIVTYTGRIKVKKGLNHFLKLAEQFPEVYFLMVGSEGRGAIEVKAEQLSNVGVVGWQDKASTARYIEASDILYIPTSTVAREKAMNTVLPLKTFIYKASGKPILAPDMQDIREVLTDHKTALLVEPDNDEAASVALQTLIRDPELRDRLGSQARLEMEELSWQNRAQKVLGFIKNRLSELS